MRTNYRLFTILIFGLIIYSPTKIFSQCFDTFYKEGIKAYNNLDFEIALNQFKAADICEDKPVQNDLYFWIDKTKNGYINEIENARNFAETNLAIAERLIDAFYFYKNKYALVVKPGYSYFIDKNGTKIDKFGIWSTAEQFNKNGLSKVTKVKADTTITFDSALVEEEVSIKVKEIQHFAIDTLGNKYRLAISLAQFDDSTEVVDFSDRRIEEIQKIDFQNSIVKLVFFENMDLNIFPKNILYSKSIEELDLSKNKIETLPTSISNSSKITHLNLSQNEIKSLPPEMGNLKKISHLNLAGNKLKQIPSELGGLTNLKTLYLGNNEITNLPEELSNLSSLETLNLTSNKIEQFNLQLNRLTRLFIDRNHLSSFHIPNGKLSNIEYLRLSNNELDSIPSEIKYLSKLTSLDISNNSIYEIPSEIGELQNLIFLNISGNPIKKLPVEVRKLKNLKILVINKDLPIEEVETIRRYLPECKIRVQGFLVNE